MNVRALVFGSVSSLALVASTAQAAALLHPKYSANLSSNKAVRQQQLLCDPQGVTLGSTSTDYNPAVSSIDTVTAEPGFGITGVYVDVVSGDTTKAIDAYSGTAVGSVDVETSGVLDGYTQSGEMQVFWAAVTSTQVDIAESGADENTDYLTFDYLPGSNSVDATYTNFGAGPSDDVHMPDFLEGYLPTCANMLTIYTLDPKSPYFYPAGFGSTTVSGPLVPGGAPAPEPASIGLLSVVGLGLGLRRRRPAR